MGTGLFNVQTHPIKFRAWDEDNRRMLSADYLCETGLGWVFNNDGFIPMQYIGRKDIHGREIYEGDIVRGRCATKRVFVCQGLQLANAMGKVLVGKIAYSTSYAQFYFTTDDITYLDLLMGLNDVEVIGNIYENPDLLIKYTKGKYYGHMHNQRRQT